MLALALTLTLTLALTPTPGGGQGGQRRARVRRDAAAVLRALRPRPTGAGQYGLRPRAGRGDGGAGLPWLAARLHHAPEQSAAHGADRRARAAVLCPAAPGGPLHRLARARLVMPRRVMASGT